MGSEQDVPAVVRLLSPKREGVFPNLRGEYEVTSDDIDDYNCIAHAADVKDARWWPVAGVDGVFWPAGVPLEETVDAFIQAFSLRGYTICNSADLETGFEKVVIYTDADGVPTHAARQLPSGAWTSKLGGWEDISHNTLRAVEGSEPAYGSAACFLRRPVAEQVQLKPSVTPGC